MNSRFKQYPQAYEDRNDFQNGVNQNGTNGKVKIQSQMTPVFPQVSHDAATVKQSPSYTRHTPDKFRLTLWQRLSLRTKVTAIAVAGCIFPLLAFGATAYYLTNKKITEDVSHQQQALVISIVNELDSFTLERYRDVQTIAQLGILNDPDVREATSDKEKQAVLDRYLEKGYDSIAVTDLAGNTILQSAGHPATGIGMRNFGMWGYFQQVIKTNRPVITPPSKSVLSKEYVIFVAAPIVDTTTGETIGVVRTRTPVTYLNQILQTEAKQLAQVEGFEAHKEFVVDNSGKVFVATEAKYVGKDAKSVFPSAASQLQAAVGSVIDINQLDRKEYMVSYARARIQGRPELNWAVMVAQPYSEAFVAGKQLLLILAIGTVVIALLVGAITAYLIKRALRPVLKATKAVQEIGQGQVITPIAVEGKDELAVLGSNINDMAYQLQTLLKKQKAEAKLSHLFTEITISICQSLNLSDILTTAVKEVRKALKTDRVLIYSFNPDWSGTIVAESVASGWTETLVSEIDESCFKDRELYVEQYKNGRVRVIDNIYQAGLTDCYLRFLERFEVKAHLVAPILRDNRLLGLMIAHQCSATRAWQQTEIDLFTQVATQVGVAIHQASLLEQLEQRRIAAELLCLEQRQQKEHFQLQVVELRSFVESVSRGDLTVQAQVSAGEIGTVAELFNAIVESLRQLVTQVKTAAAQVNVAVGENTGAIHQLAVEAFKQAEEITYTLEEVDQMTLSIQAVADSTRTAAVVARTASTTAEAGEAAIDRTVQSILDLGSTVSQTALKVKRLGESSQQISQVVFLINQIAMQTNVLAINASIEAARAGEDGRGFALVAQEVGQLAAASGAATKEIEQIVANIQRETLEVVSAMEQGTTQVTTAGTEMVADTKKSLGQILDLSRQIDQLVQSISTATVSQAQTAEVVTNLMKQIAKGSECTSDSCSQVSGSLQLTLEVTQQLQAEAGAFKVES
jgi:twitching motility protein PilJ